LAEDQRLLAAEQRQRADDQARASQRLRQALIGAIILLVLAAASALFALQQARVALSRQLAGQALALLDDQPELALLLSVEAYQTDHNSEARGSLLATLEHDPPLRFILSGHRPAAVTQVAFSPDGKRFVTSSDDTTLIIWDIATRQP